MVLRVREISNDEGNHLRHSIRHSKEPIEMKRAQVILASAQHFTVQKIAVISQMSEGYIRTLIHQFNADGVAMLKPRWNPGDRHKFDLHTRRRLVELGNWLVGMSSRGGGQRIPTRRRILQICRGKMANGLLCDFRKSSSNEVTP